MELSNFLNRKIIDDVSRINYRSKDINELYLVSYLYTIGCTDTINNKSVEANICNKEIAFLMIASVNYAYNEYFFHDVVSDKDLKYNSFQNKNSKLVNTFRNKNIKDFINNYCKYMHTSSNMEMTYDKLQAYFALLKNQKVSVKDFLSREEYTTYKKVYNRKMFSAQELLKLCDLTYLNINNNNLIESNICDYKTYKYSPFQRETAIKNDKYFYTKDIDLIIGYEENPIYESAGYKIFANRKDDKYIDVFSNQEFKIDSTLIENTLKTICNIKDIFENPNYFEQRQTIKSNELLVIYDALGGKKIKGQGIGLYNIENQTLKSSKVKKLAIKKQYLD